jgi:hypothetical protein
MSKHSPMTSEPSNPHSSKAEPQEHVDVHHFDEHGQKDDSLTVSHVTDKGMVDYGKEAQEHRDSQKNDK